MNAAEELSEVTEKVIKADREVDQQLRRNIKLEAQSRRNNSKFFNVKENEAESSFSNTEKVLRKYYCLLIHLMPKEEAADVEFERVHCIPTHPLAEYNPGKPRPIVAKLSFYKDKSCIFQYAKKHQPKQKNWRWRGLSIKSLKRRAIFRQPEYIQEKFP